MSYATTFANLRTKAGSPTLTCIKPRSEWSGLSAVPAGYSYDADYDVFVDVSGNTWKPDQGDSWGSGGEPSDSVNFLPTIGGMLALDLMMGGLVDTGERSGRILPADKTTVEDAAWIELDSQTYDLAELTPAPAGNPLWYSVRLKKR